MYAALAQFQVSEPTPSGIPFGGFITAFVPASPVCTAHTVLFDFVTMRVIGVAVNVNSEVYRNYNLVTVGKALLGTYAPVPLPCPLPYQVWSISQVGTS